MSRVVFSLGSNLGDREAHLAAAVAAIAPELVSEVYETPPWGGDDDQGAYYNVTAVADDPGRGADDWLELAQELEIAAGRVRDPDRPYGPRTLDVDLIAVWDEDGHPPARRTAPRTAPPAGPPPRVRARALAGGRPRRRAPRKGPSARDAAGTGPCGGRARTAQAAPDMVGAS
ncbi:hypothetical protein GCM10029992_06190 [Glycomyces albus]